MLFSQEKYLNLGLSYSSIYSNYKFVSPIIDEYNFETAHTYNLKYNYSTGICLEYTAKIYLLLNLNYTTKGYILNYNYTAFTQSDPFLPLSSTIEAGYANLSLSIGKPLKLTKKLNFIPNAKIVYNYLINNRVMTLSGDNKKYVENGDNGILIKQELLKQFFNSGLAVAIKYKLSKKIFINFEPAILYSFNKISQISMEKNKVYYALKFGLYLNIGKYEN
jgi:hypothetical protein